MGILLVIFIQSPKTSLPCTVDAEMAPHGSSSAGHLGTSSRQSGPSRRFLPSNARKLLTPLNALRNTVHNLFRSLTGRRGPLWLLRTPLFSALCSHTSPPWRKYQPFCKRIKISGTSLSTSSRFRRLDIRSHLCPDFPAHPKLSRHHVSTSISFTFQTDQNNKLEMTQCGKPWRESLVPHTDTDHHKQ